MMPDLMPPLQEAHPGLIAQAWHDITCAEGPDCRDRGFHSTCQAIANSGHLAMFLERLAELHAQASVVLPVLVERGQG